MSDEALTWKSFLLLLNKQNEKVLGNLLTDNGMLNLKLNQALRMLSEFSLDSNGYKNSYNNLQAANMMLLNLKNAQNKGTNQLVKVLGLQNFSYNETFF